MYIISLIPAVLLAAAIFRILTATQGHHQLAFAVLVAIIVCATHVIFLVLYPIRPSKPLAVLLGVMAFISLGCLFLLAVSGRPNYQIQYVKPATNSIQPAPR